MLFVLGVFFIIVTLGIVVYNRPKGQPVIEAILDSTDTLYVDRAVKKFKKEKNKKKRKKKKRIEPQVIIGDDCSESLECPKSMGNGGMKNERRCRAIIERIYGEKFPTVRPKWLKNPATRRNLELDCYCHRLHIEGREKPIRLALEYDGSQHTKMTSYHGGDKRKLLNQMKRDKYKELKCKKLGITLIRVPYWAKGDLEGFITRKLDEIGILPSGYSKHADTKSFEI